MIRDCGDKACTSPAEICELLARPRPRDEQWPLVAEQGMPERALPGGGITRR